MSVQMFKGVGGNGKPMISAESGATSTLYAVRCSAKISVPVSDQNGAIRSQAISWDSPGTSIENAIKNAGDVLQAVLDMSKGELTFFGMQLGLFRNDKLATPVPSRTLSYAVVGLTNAETGAGAPVTVAKKMCPRLYVPFVKDTVSDLDVENNVKTLVNAGKLASISFATTAKESFYLGTMSNTYGVTKKRWRGQAQSLLDSNDSESGIEDGVIRGS